MNTISKGTQTAYPDREKGVCDHMDGRIMHITQELAMLRSMTVRELQEKYFALYGEPSRTNNKDFLRKRVGRRIQEIAENTPPDSAEDLALEERLAGMAKIRWRGEAKRPVLLQNVLDGRDPRLPPPGSKLRRTFKNVEHVVTVQADAFEYRGKVYKNLTKIATEISGSKWNGFVFFGLGKKEGHR